MIANAAGHCDSGSTSAHPQTFHRLFVLRVTALLMAPSPKFHLAHRSVVSRSPRSVQTVRGRISSAMASVAPVAASYSISAPILTTARADSGVQSTASDALCEHSQRLQSSAESKHIACRTHGVGASASVGLCEEMCPWFALPPPDMAPGRRRCAPCPSLRCSAPSGLRTKSYSPYPFTFGPLA